MNHIIVYDDYIVSMASSSSTLNIFKVFVLLLACSLAVPVADARTITLTVKDKPLQQMRYGMDYERLWFWTGGLSAEEKALVAQWSVVDCDIDYVRVAINSSYELEEGKYNPKAYDRILDVMRYMQEANPKIKFFASPRPLNESFKGKAKDNTAWQPYPIWITGNNGKKPFDFDWEKCAEYLVRYIELMKSHGFKISYLDVTNEWQSTGEGGKLTGDDTKRIHKYLQSKLDADDMPLLIAPSSWNFQQGAAWIRELRGGEKRAVSIASSHNTDKTGSAEGFAEAVKSTLGKDTEIWNTELHGWKSVSRADEVLTASFFLEAIRAGFSGISGWLAIGTPNQGHSYILNQGGSPKRNVKYFIFKQIANTSHRGHALEINQPKELKSTAALIRDDLLTVWVINDSDEDIQIQIQPTGKRFAERSIVSTRWSEVHSLPVEGITETIATEADATLLSKSLYCFEIKVK